MSKFTIYSIQCNYYFFSTQLLAIAREPAIALENG